MQFSTTREEILLFQIVKENICDGISRLIILRDDRRSRPQNKKLTFVTDMSAKGGGGGKTPRP